MSENRRMIRAHEGRMITGVCAGLGHYTRIDPVVFRVAFAVLTVAAGGSGIFLYIVAYVLMPDEETDGSIAERVIKRRLDGDAVLTVLGGMLTIGVVSSVLGGGFGAGLASGPVTTVTVFALALLIAHARGVNLLQVARTLPERFQGPPYQPQKREMPPPPPPEGMIDLATLSSPATSTRSGTTKVLPTEQVPLGPPPDPSPEPWTEPISAPERSSSGGCGVTPLFTFAALAAGAGAFLFTSGQLVTTRVSISVAVALAVLGIGLIVASWYGRSRGLVSLGVVLCLALVTTSAVGELPQGARWGDVAWRPATTQSEQTYKVAVGNGTLDLMGMPLQQGQRVRVHAEVVLGKLTVIVPSTARTEVQARSGLGDLDIDGKVTSGHPGARVNTVLPAEGKAAKNAPVIELHVRGRISDVEVHRA
jgi:phage shock protein PspC (stress-responsive transcriptional regulator)